ncbi:MAG: PIN domain-containing protein [bacterium (Candidatus Stahlbacteria) CG08_land_8_20_14_0_20_40_26]|nr:MAG: PIN domain-containing protein [bacterium (Candidatus Stahlbacteria) CG23_combo_of_CG06-09_8_20_14_all_40_9]PIS24338.1 MAG: PIN domain-containing protein [bacterium (Candidatus Stahlbacteria) CG08_land_8_20_14_0_20_40_26]
MNAKLKVYLDTSVYNRPFDDQSQPRVRIETLAFISVLQLVESDKIDLISSRVLEYENSKNPFSHRRKWIEHYISFAKYIQGVTPSIKKRARELEKQGLEPIDALHIACAEASEVNYFLTCDDEILSRYKGRIKVINPVNFIMMKGGSDV